MKPKLIKGGSHSDNRGTIHFNNDFDASDIKRIYTIENESTSYIRAWQGHKIERRWFSALNGSFEIKLIKVDNWEQPNNNAEIYAVSLNSTTLDTLYVPAGYISSIQAIEANAKLLVMSDYRLGDIQDEYRFAPDYSKR